MDSSSAGANCPLLHIGQASYSSKNCPTCEQLVAQSESTRYLYCPNRRKYLRRDTLGGRNVVNILRTQVKKKERPLYLQSVDKDGRYPWKERKDEIASSSKDAAGSSQQAGSGGDGGGKRKQTKDGRAGKGKI
ncbi:hypothetical protein BGZ79_006769 [Entomortierella chlamydospora]|nr:hypothetical protein BGZ79_006769 [Entomortierella chlamydospora]